MRRNSEQPRHLLVGHAIAESGKHLDFARRQQNRRLLRQRVEISALLVASHVPSVPPRRRAARHRSEPSWRRAGASRRTLHQWRRAQPSEPAERHRRRHRSGLHRETQSPRRARARTVRRAWRAGLAPPVPTPAPQREAGSEGSAAVRSSRWSDTDRYRKQQEVARPDQMQFDLLSDRIRPETLGNHRGPGDAFAGDLQQNVAGVQARLGGGAVLGDAHDHQAARLAGFGLQCFRHEDGLKRQDRANPVRRVPSRAAGRAPLRPSRAG